MPSVDNNRGSWDDSYDWSEGGDEWSSAWGSTAAMWFGSILPRIAPLLPAEHLLEIAPGFGRVTQFLLPHCARYTGIDLADKCVEACRQRFDSVAHATFTTNDGYRLDSVDAESVDVAFSWDSLVHADRGVLESYVQELAAKLAPDGRAFLHHSNLAAFVDPASGEPTVENPHWRDRTVSADIVADAARAAGLACVSQELVGWGMQPRVDCFTVLLRPGPTRVAPSTPTARVEHPDFNAELGHFHTLDGLYWSPWQPRGG